MKKMLFILLFIIPNSFVYACSCGEWDFDFSVKQADAIFLGEVISIDFDKYPFMGETYDQVNTFEISKKWKGTSSNRI